MGLLILLVVIFTILLYNSWLLKRLTFKKANIYKSRIVSVCVNVDFFSSALTQRGEGQAN